MAILLLAQRREGDPHPSNDHAMSTLQKTLSLDGDMEMFILPWTSPKISSLASDMETFVTAQVSK